MISFFSDGCLRDIVAKIQKVEDKTKKLVSFLSRQRIFANYILAKLQKNGSSNLMFPSKKR